MCGYTDTANHGQCAHPGCSHRCVQENLPAQPTSSGETSHLFWRWGSRTRGITAQGHPHPPPSSGKLGGGGSNFKAMAPWLGPQVRERKGPRDHLMWYPSLQARKLRVPPCPRSHSSTAQGLKPLPSWVYSLFLPVLSWRLRLPLVGREGHVIK